MKIVKKCSAALPRIRHDFGRGRHTRGFMVLAQKSASVGRGPRFIDDAARAGHHVVLFPISLAEIVYLIEKGRLPNSAYHDLAQALSDPDYVIA